MSERKDLPEDELGNAYWLMSTCLVAAVRVAGVNRKEQNSVSVPMANDSSISECGWYHG
ncbi:hypothetical protein HQN89_10175 [Paenibacillus frigoriresistens]|nr:hypothetical protein [Paenibacillus frigoriresistens]